MLYSNIGLVSVGGKYLTDWDHDSQTRGRGAQVLLTQSEDSKVKG